MKLRSLRVHGFKSFADSTTIEFHDGITAVVGPNGCGKSNLVEAIKWVMGETSAKQIRGSEMDDVIFSGTSNRPGRNIAEVGLEMENTERKSMLVVKGLITSSGAPMKCIGTQISRGICF